MDFFRYFQMWVESNVTSFIERDFTVSLREISTGIDNPSISIDISSEQFVARATLWFSGEYQEEAIDAATGDTIHWEYYPSLMDKEIAEYLKKFIDKLDMYKQS